MLRKLLVFGTLATGLSASGLSSGAPSGEPPQELIHSKPKRIAHDVAGYGGVVAAVGPDWFELGPGWEGETARKRPLDNSKPLRLSAAGTTAMGDPRGEGRPTSHLVTDLKAGDKVSVQSCISRGGEEWVSEVQIRRRPGGKIPPYFRDPFLGTQYAGHLRNQAYQDWEEKGVPIPARYLSDGRAPWTNPPYPPAAPLPREKGAAEDAYAVTLTSEAMASATRRRQSDDSANIGGGGIPGRAGHLTPFSAAKPSFLPISGWPSHPTWPTYSSAEH